MEYFKAVRDEIQGNPVRLATWAAHLMSRTEHHSCESDRISSAVAPSVERLDSSLEDRCCAVLVSER